MPLLNDWYLNLRKTQTGRCVYIERGCFKSKFQCHIELADCHIKPVVCYIELVEMLVFGKLRLTSNQIDSLRQYFGKLSIDITQACKDFETTFTVNTKKKKENKFYCFH